MHVAVFSTKPYDRETLIRANEAFGHELQFFEAALTPQTCSLAETPVPCACLCTTS